jgi:Uncharacterised protein family (UPF0158)
MTTSVRLEDLIDALEEESEFQHAFFDRDTGEILVVSQEALEEAESEEDPIDRPDWQEEEIELARRIQGSDRCIAFPSQFDVHEWNIMKDFSLQIKPEDTKAALLRSIHGGHAFRRFKDDIAHFDLWDAWNRFRRQAFEEIMRDWCEENGINLAVPQKQSARR